MGLNSRQPLRMSTALHTNTHRHAMKTHIITHIYVNVAHALSDMQMHTRTHTACLVPVEMK